LPIDVNEIYRRLINLEGTVNKLDTSLKQILNALSPLLIKEPKSPVNLGIVDQLKSILSNGFVWAGNVVNALADSNGGITVTGAGIATKRKVGYGIYVDSSGLKLNKQAAIVDAVDVTVVAVTAGADHIDIADLNTKLSTNATEINAIKTKLNALLASLRLAEVITT
jgi:hypothetical protein